jgi:oligopeptide transport system permease protein
MSGARWLWARIWDAFTLWVSVLLATFFLLRLAPGGPFDSERAFAPEVLANLNRHYGLDLPLSQQFLKWMSALFRGDLGESFTFTGTSVTELIAAGFGVSIQVGGLALLFGLLTGGALAMLSLGSRFWTGVYSLFVTIGLSVPSFLSGSVLVLIFSSWLGVLPPALLESPASFILPALTLALRPLAQTARIIRAQLVSTRGADFVRTARAKGASPLRVLIVHQLRPALLSLISVLPPLFAGILTGSFVIEAMFQIPGLGKHFVGAVLNRDFPLVMGVTLVYGTLLIANSLSCEVLSRRVDPRLKETYR